MVRELHRLTTILKRYMLYHYFIIRFGHAVPSAMQTDLDILSDTEAQQGSYMQRTMS